MFSLVLIFLLLKKKINLKHDILIKLRSNVDINCLDNSFWTKFRRNPKEKLRLHLIVPTFVTKVSKYLCSGWVFFSDKIELFNWPF